MLSYGWFGNIIKESYGGYSHEKLSFLQRIIAGVSLIPIGAIAKWLKGVFKGGINSLLRRAGKSTITNIGEEVTEAIIKNEVRGLENNIASEVAEDVVRETVEEIGEIEGREVVESVIKEVNESVSNSYSGEEWCRYFRETYGNNNVTWENATPSQLARSWQGSGKYIGIDEYTDVTVNKGTILYRGEPNGTEYFTTLDAIEQSGRNATTIFEGLQVDKNPIHGYRGEMQGYLFNEDVASAYGITNANPQFGKGGLPQYYVPDVQDLIDKGILTPVDNIKLNK